MVRDAQRQSLIVFLAKASTQSVQPSKSSGSSLLFTTFGLLGSSGWFGGAEVPEEPSEQDIEAKNSAAQCVNQSNIQEIINQSTCVLLQTA
jgi:hypothetical protein